MRLLIIEDQPEFIERVVDAFKKVDSTVEILTPDDTGLKDKFDESGDADASLEEQMLAKVRSLQAKHPIDLVLLDTDLSRLRNGITQSLCRQAFQEVGIPVCRYRKRSVSTHVARLQDLHRLARESASAVWVPSELLRPETLEAALVPWLLAVADGFAQLRRAIIADPKLLTAPLGPAGILATMLGHPSLKADLLGYTAQNFFFFGAPTGEDGDDPAKNVIAAAQATRLGYWLINSILMFPGPILSAPAAAAYLNLTIESFNLPSVQALTTGCIYRGPFAAVEPFYWRDELAELIDRADGDIAKAPELKAEKLERVDEDPGSSAYLCLLTQEPIPVADAAPRLDWIPVGAQLARVRNSLYDQLGPMLSI
jgi:hypothetical protein